MAIRSFGLVVGPSRKHTQGYSALQAKISHSQIAAFKLRELHSASARAPQKDGTKLRGTTVARQIFIESKEILQEDMALMTDTWNRCCMEHMQLLEAFRVTSRREAKDVAAALILSEAVYKAIDGSLNQAVDDVSSLLAGLPEPFHQPLKVQWSLPHVAHRYLIAEGVDSIFVAFMGTKLKADLLTNAKVYQELLWGDQHFKRGQPAAHMGFVRRARSVPTQALWKLAQQKGKRLVFCGHSLGGSVAEICVLDLLHAFGRDRRPDVQAIGFATPAIGNQALADHVAENGWQQHLTSYLLPEDKIGKMFAFLPGRRPNEVLQAAQAATLYGAECLQKETAASPSPHSSPSEEAGCYEGQVAAQAVKNNIVPFPSPQQAPQVEELVSRRSSYTYISWAASLLYRTMTFPFWAHKSYVPPARRLYLNPTGVGRAPEQSQAAVLAAASAAAFRDYKEVLQNATQGTLSYKVQLMWMHRLPAYRTRFQQIMSQAAAGERCKSSSVTRSLELSDSLFPSVSLSGASYFHLSGCACFGLENSILFATSTGAQPQHWQKIFSRLSTMKTLRLVAWAGEWLERHGWSLHSADPLCLVIQLRGTGLRHCTSFQLQLPNGQTCKAEVVCLREASPLLSLSTAISTTTGAAAEDLMAWLGVSKRQGKSLRRAKETVMLKARLSHSQAKGLQDLHNDQLKLHWQTDFQEGRFPMQPSPFSVRSIERAGVPSSEWKLCQKC